MKILMTQRELRHFGGSEMCTIEVAKELRQRGHEVAVFCPAVGELRQILLNVGVWVAPSLSELPWEPDVIHGQHHLQAMAALAYFEHVPAVYHCHGVQPWVEKPPLHARIRHYIMMCEWMVPRMGPEFGIPADRVYTIPNFVNTQRFSQVRTPPARPVRALLFGNTRLCEDELGRLESACAELGLTLAKIGCGYGTAQPHPEIFLQDYDLVFAIGKCALEALACGCAVITLGSGLAGRLITPENLSAWVYSNLSPRYFHSAARLHADWLRAELLGYAPESVRRVSERIRREHDLLPAVDRLEELYEKAVRALPERPPEAGTRGLAPYLEMIGAEVDAFWATKESLRIVSAERDSLRKRLAECRQRRHALVSYLRRRILGRWFLSQVKRRQQQALPGASQNSQ